MAIREIIRIDEEKCNGCGECVPTCAEGAIRIIDGKARLLSDRFCDGLGACLGNCPTGAITIEKREAADFDEKAVQAARQNERQAEQAASPPPACPGSLVRRWTSGQPPPLAAIGMAQPGSPGAAPGVQPRAASPATAGFRQEAASAPMPPSCLAHWPVQLNLIPAQAPFLKGADLVICADCVPFVVPDFHARYLTGRAVVVGCPKLDDLQAYYQKFREIFSAAGPTRITVLRLEVPCCGGIAQAAIMARKECAPGTPLEVHTLGIRAGVQIQEIPGNDLPGVWTG